MTPKTVTVKYFTLSILVNLIKMEGYMRRLAIINEILWIYLEFSSFGICSDFNSIQSTWRKTKTTPRNGEMKIEIARHAHHQWMRFCRMLQYLIDSHTFFLAATKQLYDWFSPSVRPSHLFHYVLIIIMKFSGIITMDRNDVHAKGQGQRSKVKVTEVKTQLSRFRTVTPVWIHIWQRNHAHSLQ